jgi:hypothetical protein
MFTHLSQFGTLRALTGATSLLLVGAAGVLIASDPLPPAAPVVAPVAAKPAAAKSVAVSDVTIARAVLAAIDADPTLKDVNFVVSVVDRGAVIGGPVATEEIKKRAEAVVRSVPGIESVKNVCFVQADPDPLLRAVVARLKPDAKSTGVAVLPGVALPPTAPEGFLPPVPPQPPSDLVVVAPKPVEALRPALPTGPAVNVLGAPVAPGSIAKAQPLPTTAPAVPAALTGSPSSAGATDVQTAVAAVRKADPRFARLTVESKPDGGLLVTGWSAKAADAWDFAAELRKLPGVARVAVDPQLVK